MAAAVEPTGSSTRKDMRRIVMLMLIRIAHVRAVENQRVVEQSSVAVRRGLQLVEEVRQHLNVITVDLRVVGNSPGVLGMMRASMKTGVRAACRIVAICQIARAKKRGDASHIRLERQSGKVELQLDMFIKRLRHAGGKRRDRRVG